MNSNLLDLVNSQKTGLSETLDDDLRGDAVFDVSSDFLEELRSEQSDRGCAITDFGILGTRDIDEGLAGGVDDVEESEDRRTIVGDGDVTLCVDDQLVHTSGTKS